MDRRKFLTVLTPFVAGCFGGRRGQPTTPSDGGGNEMTESTPESTPTATPEPTPDTSAEAAEHIDTARDHLKEAVYVYVDGVSNDLTSVTAETDAFRPRDVLLKLDAVQKALYAAESEAATSEQKQTVDSLMDVQTFLTHATDLQSWLIDGHDAVTAAYEELETDDVDAAVDDLSRIGTAVDETEDPLATITEETDATSMDATNALSGDGYSEKVTQLKNEQSMLAKLETYLTDITDAVELIDDALNEEDEGRYDDAADTADRAYDLLTEAEEQLTGLADDPPERADSFADVVDDLADTAATYANEADRIAQRN